MTKRIALIAVCTAFGALGGESALAQAPAAPLNDHYLQSLRLNEPGKRLERTDTLRDIRDTTSATVQGDMFNPPSAGGPAEPTVCQGAGYGKTVWYDFYPDVNGLARIRTGGFDTAVSVMPFNRTSGVPNVDRRLCFNESSSTSEEVFVEVRRGGAYTIQLGGVNGAAGSLEFLFDFLADTDADGVLDDADRCRTVAGSGRDGCPPRLRADVTLRARPTPTGIEIVRLAVTASRGSRVAVSCGLACARQVKRARGGTVSFGALSGRDLGAGTSLVVRVTRKGAIGTYVAYRITSGNFKKIERCMNPGSSTPRRRCG
jgi:hypothetical protein